MTAKLTRREPAQMSYRDVVRGIALDNYGLATTRAAVAAGGPAVELPKLAARGGLDHVAHGLTGCPTCPLTR